jgi:hypothetical protein
MSIVFCFPDRSHTHPQEHLQNWQTSRVTHLLAGCHASDGSCQSDKSWLGVVATCEKQPQGSCCAIMYVFYLFYNAKAKLSSFI